MMTREYRVPRRRGGGPGRAPTTSDRPAGTGRTPARLIAVVADRARPTVRQAYGPAQAGLLGYETGPGSGLALPTGVLIQVCDPDTGQPRYDDNIGQVVVNLAATGRTPRALRHRRPVRPDPRRRRLAAADRCPRPGRRNQQGTRRLPAPEAGGGAGPRTRRDRTPLRHRPNRPQRQPAMRNRHRPSLGPASIAACTRTDPRTPAVVRRSGLRTHPAGRPDDRRPSDWS
jgi:hypothetical protein